MMDEKPELRGGSHGGDERKSQARTQALINRAIYLNEPAVNTENESIVLFLRKNKSCLTQGETDKCLFTPMPLRSFSYWFICSIAAVIAAGAAESDMAASSAAKLSADSLNGVFTVPEPSRAFLLFAGIMAMAFTYRHAWLGWKRSAQP
jgi:hypothetical protein